MIDAAECESSHFSDEFLDKLNAQRVPPHSLTLKVNDNYFFIVRNYSYADELTSCTKDQIIRLPRGGLLPGAKEYCPLHVQ